MVSPKSKITILVLLATLTGCQCLLHNLLRDIGRTVSGVYKCSRGFGQSATSNMMPGRSNYDLRIEIKDGKARIWLPGRLYQQMNPPRPFSVGPWNYEPIPYYSIIQSRAQRDLSQQNNILPLENSVEQIQENIFPKYPAIVPLPFLVPPKKSEENNPEQELTPPKIQNENEVTLEPSLSVPVDFDEINKLADLNSENKYRTIPFSDYGENELGNGLLENYNNIEEFSNKPALHNPDVPSASIDSGYGAIPLYK